MENMKILYHYASFVGSKIKLAGDILRTITLTRMQRIHMALGMAGEAGEVVDIVKKEVIYLKAENREKICEELGDLLFYMVGLASSYDISLQEIIIMNTAKLEKRYVSKYTDIEASKRADAKSAFERHTEGCMCTVYGVRL